MIKALFKKQLSEVFSWLYTDRKKGQRRQGTALCVSVLLYCAMFFLLGYIFYMFASSLCEPLVQLGLGWLYVSITSLLSVVLGVFGCVFNTYASLYRAKDNDFLLSMPIKTGYILIMRLSGVYAIGLLYQLLVSVPSFIVWLMTCKVTVPVVLFGVLLMFIISVFVLSLSCALGWVVGKISGKVKNKAFVTVFFSLAFIALYYYVYFNAYNYLMSFMSNAGEVAQKLAHPLNPLYALGRAGEGDILSMLYITMLVLLLFFIVYTVLKLTYLKTVAGGAQSVGKGGSAKISKPHSADFALLKKEIKRFTKSANYMLNCGLGCLMSVIMGVFLLIKQNDARQIINELSALLTPQLVALIAAAAICTVAAMNDITAPSVSLEGKSIWVLRSLPVDAYSVLRAKLRLHLLLTLPPVVFLFGCMQWVLRLELVYAALVLVLSVLFVILTAQLGLIAGLKGCNLSWTNEVVPIKQSGSVLLVLLGSWCIIILCGVVYYLLSSLISPLVYMLLLAVLLGAMCVLMLMWLKKKGSALFSHIDA